MSDLLVALLASIFAGLIVVIIEYFIIQPIKKTVDRAVPSSAEINRDWATAIAKAIKYLRMQHYGLFGQWIPRPKESIEVQKWTINKGRATLILSVIKMIETIDREFTAITQMPHTLAQYTVTIDRSGDILEFYASRFEEPPVSLPPLREMTVEIANKKQPRIETANGGVNAVLEFAIRNTGRAGTICLYIEFKVVTSRVDGHYSPRTFKTKPKPLAINAMGLTPVKLSLFFPFPELPLIDPPHNVTIELQSCL